MTLVDRPARPNPLSRPRVAMNAFPSPTTTRFLVILAAVAGAGFFVGDWIYLSINGRAWFEVWQQCRASYPDVNATDIGGIDEALRRQTDAKACMGGVENTRAWYSFGAAGIAMLTGVLALFVTPVVMESRRHLSRIDDSKVAAAGVRVRELASQTRLRRPPTVMLGQPDQADGFSYGSPRRYRIALPPAIAVRWRHSELFDPVIFHELAHLEHRDVGYSWLTRGAMYAIAPIMAVPLVISVVNTRYAEATGYAWRAVVLAVTIYLIAAQLLRSREFDADLRAATYLGGPQRIIDLISAMPERSRGTFGRLLAYHPLPSMRVNVLIHPHIAAEVRFLDGFAPAFLAAGAIPVFDSTAVAFGTANPIDPYAHVIAYGIAGTLLGITVGLGTVRAAVVCRAVDIRPRRWYGASGVGLGLIAGELVGLSATASTQWSFGDLAWSTAPFLLGLSATALTFGVAEVCADAAPRLRSPQWVWLPAVAVASLVFGAALYLVYVSRTFLGIPGGWTILLGAGELTLVKPAMVAVALIVVAAAAVSARENTYPRWIFDGEAVGPVQWTAPVHSARVPIVIGGACAAAALVPYAYFRHHNVFVPTYDSINTLVYATEAFAVIAAAAGVISLVVFDPRRGVAFAAPAGLITIVLFMAGMAAFFPPGHRHGLVASADISWRLTDQCVGVLFLVLIGLAPLTLIPRVWGNGIRRTTVLAVILALALCVPMAVL